VAIGRSARRAGTATLLLLAVLLVAGLVFNLSRIGRELDAGRQSDVVSWNSQDIGVLLGVIPLMPLALGLTALILLLGEPGGAAPRTARKRLRFARPRVSAGTALFLVLVIAVPAFFWFVQISIEGRSQDPFGPAYRDPLEEPTVYLGDAFKLALLRAAGIADSLVGIAVAFGQLILLVPLPVVPIAVMLLAEGGLVVFMLARRRKRRPTVVRASGPDTVRPVEPHEPTFGTDVRSTIVRCFHEFSVLIERCGLDTDEPLTPRELEDVAVVDLGVDRDAVDPLTRLFEIARYSTHPLRDDDGMRAEASLGRIRAEVRTPSVAPRRKRHLPPPPRWSNPDPLRFPRTLSG